MFPSAIPFVMAGLAALGLVSCGDGGEVNLGQRSQEPQGGPGGSGGASGSAGNSGGGGAAGQGGAAGKPVCLSEHPNQPFIVSLNGKQEAANGDAVDPVVNNQGTFAFGTVAGNFFPPDTGVPIFSPQLFARNFSQGAPTWVTPWDPGKPNTTQGQYSRIAGDLVGFEGPPDAFGFDTSKEGNLFSAPILFRLSDGLRVWIGSDPTMGGNLQLQRWLVFLALAETPGQGFRLAYNQVLTSNNTDTIKDSQIKLAGIDKNLKEVDSKTVSVDPMGVSGNGISMMPVISPNGRFVAFVSLATNLDPAHPPVDPGFNLYLRDLETQQTQRIPFDDGIKYNEQSPLSYSAIVQCCFVDDQGNIAFHQNVINSSYFYNRAKHTVEKISFPSPSANKQFNVVALSADGKKLIYEVLDASNAAGLSFSIVLRNLETGLDYLLNDPQAGAAEEIKISPNGRWITWQGRKGMKDPYQIYGLEICDETQLKPYK